LSAEPAPPFQTTLGGIPNPRYSWEAANKAYVDASTLEGGLIHYAENDSIGAAGRRSLQSWIYGGTIRESAGGVPSNTDFIAIRDLAITAVKWSWRGTILSGQPTPYMAIYDTAASAEILSTPIGVRDEVHSFSPTGPAAIEEGKAYSLQFNTTTQFPQNNIFRFTAEFLLAPPSKFSQCKRRQDKLLKELAEISIKKSYRLSPSVQDVIEDRVQKRQKKKRGKSAAPKDDSSRKN